MNQSSPSITNITVKMETNTKKMDVIKKKVSTHFGNLFSKEGSKNQFVPRRKNHGNCLYWGVLFFTAQLNQLQIVEESFLMDSSFYESSFSVGLPYSMAHNNVGQGTMDYCV